MSASAGHGIYYGKNENDRLQPITWLNDNYSLFLEQAEIRKEDWFLRESRRFF